MRNTLNLGQAVERARRHFARHANSVRALVEVLSVAHDARRRAYVIQCAVGPSEHRVQAHEVWVSEADGAVTCARTFQASNRRTPLAAT